jgi:hypothetical protein
LAYDFGQPSNIPVFVLASRQTDAFRQAALTQRLSVLILDKRTGREVYNKTMDPVAAGPTTFSPFGRGIQFTPKIDEQKLLIDFQDWNMELKFTGEEKSSK